MSLTSVAAAHEDAQSRSWMDWSLIKVFHNPAAVFRVPIRLREIAAAIVASAAAMALMQYADIFALDLDLVLSEYAAQLDIDAAERAKFIEAKKTRVFLSPLLNSFAFYPIGIAAIGLFFFACGYVLRAEASFRKIFSNVAMAYWPCLAVWAVWAVLVHAVGADGLRSGLNLAQVAPEIVPKWFTMSVLDSIDVFNLWLIVLTTLGLIAAGFRKSRALLSVSVFWILYLTVKASLTIAYSAPELKEDCILCKLEEKKSSIESTEKAPGE